MERAVMTTLQDEEVALGEAEHNFHETPQKY